MIRPDRGRVRGLLCNATVGRRRGLLEPDKIATASRLYRLPERVCLGCARCGWTSTTARRRATSSSCPSGHPEGSCCRTATATTSTWTSVPTLKNKKICEDVPPPNSTSEARSSPASFDSALTPRRALGRVSRVSPAGRQGQQGTLLSTHMQFSGPPRSESSYLVLVGVTGVD